MTVKRNIIANFAGSAWSALMSLAFVPFYIKLMGVESYGIVGVYTSLVGMTAILDLGLSQAMNREMARLSAQPDNARMADTAHTLEIVYWAIALVVTGIVMLISGFVAYRWLNPEHLSRESLQQAIWIMALVVGLRWPVAIYLGGLNGLQRQVQANVLTAVFATLQGLGALVVLWLVQPTIQAFFMWQALVAVLQAVALRAALWHSISGDSKGAFRVEVLRDIWRFAAGMTGIAVVATVLTQMDKVLLSRMLTLAEFGYYTFAATVAMVIYKIIGPVFTAYYPRLTELVSRGDQAGLVRTFHQGCQLMAVAILPVTLVLALFSGEILALWTRNPEVVAQSSLLVSLLVVGNALNGLMHIPYALQLAHGWTRLAFYQNVVAVIILVPAIYVATLRWGAVGASSVWIVLNSGYALIAAQVMFRRLLPAEKLHWYLGDVAKPLLTVLLVAGNTRIFMGGVSGNTAKIVMLALTLAGATVMTIASAETLRHRILPSWVLRAW